MRKLIMFFLVFACALMLTACSNAQDDKVALNSERYIKFEAIMSGKELTADDIDAISRTMLEDGTTTLDFVKNAGYAVEPSANGTKLISCFLVEYDNDSNSIVSRDHDYELKFDTGKECYCVKGKIIVESERNAIRALYRDLVSGFRWEYAVYVPANSPRFICFGDDGSPDPSHAYYYDQEQYVSVITELFTLN